MSDYDCRLELFRARGRDVLDSVVHETDVTLADPFDVEAIFPEARQTFLRTLEDVAHDQRSRILLIRGQAGCGKTHLIRSLRAQVHRQDQAMVAYVHMTAETNDYRQYLLKKVVRSLSMPYLPGATQGANGLGILADAVVRCLPPETGVAEKLFNASDAELAELVSRYADDLIELTDDQGQPRFDGVDVNTLRILLYRQSASKAIWQQVSQFFNGAELAERDWQRISALPRDWDRSPMHMLTQIARVTTSAMGVPLVICVDQIENSDLTNTNHEYFIRAMGTSCEMVEQIPSIMMLLSCLDTAYESHALALIQSYRHRIEQDTPSVFLANTRSSSEIRAILSRRVSWLYKNEGLEHIPSDSIYPLPESLPDEFNRQALRDVLTKVRAIWNKFQAVPEGSFPDLSDAVEFPVSLPPDGQELDLLRIAWTGFAVSADKPIPEEDDAQFALLTWALEAMHPELDQPASVALRRAAAPAGVTAPPSVGITIQLPRMEFIRRLIGLCDKDPRGGGFEKQIKTLDAMRSAGQRIIILRSTSFPRTGRALERLRQMGKLGDQCAVVEDATWRTMQSLKQFLATKTSDYSAKTMLRWRQADHPLTNLPGISSVVDASSAMPRNSVKKALDKAGASVTSLSSESAVTQHAVDKSEPTPQSQRHPQLVLPTVTQKPATAAAPPPDISSPMIIGMTEGFSPAEFSLSCQSLTRHTAIFGANGSGKTVLALSIIEMLLERGVSVFLFDRKGDLSSYATAEAWTLETGAPDEQRRRAALRTGLDIHLYTPGALHGRPLALRFLPSGLGQLDEPDRQEQALEAAIILTEICDPPKTKYDLFVTLFSKAVDLLCQDDKRHALDELQQMLLDPGPELLNTLPAHNEKDCAKVGQRLSERRTAHGRLFSDAGETLDLHAMLTPVSGRARLNIVSTQFLNEGSFLIWMAQFLAEAGRYVLKHPSPGGALQALLFFDEADVYIPAVRKPATKTGMDNLLRRARAAGVGIMLATQNSGDFDYKALDNILNVFAGKLSTERALDKLQSRLGSRTDRLSKKAAGHFIHEADGKVQEFLSNMSLIRPTPVPRDRIEHAAIQQINSNINAAQ